MINILLVDDNQNNRLTLELLLEEVDDVELSEAEDGEQAVAICKEKNFDLIFMDIMMPVMDGIEATTLIKEFSKSSMIIALSALDDKESKHNMLVAGAEDYLTKPIDSELFLQRVSNYINIINLRNTTIENKDAQNPFSKAVYDRLLIFNIKTEESLVQFWDYFLRDNSYNYPNFSDYIRIIYGFGLWLIRNDKVFSISIEEGEDKLYIMLNGIDFIRKTVISNIIRKHLDNALFTLKDGTLSFELCEAGSSKVKVEDDIEPTIETSTDTKTTIETSTDTKDILSKTHYDNPTAEQYVESTAIALMPKIESLEEIEEEISEAIFNFEKSSSKEMMNVICEKFNDYYMIIEQLHSFGHLVFAIKSLLEFLNSMDDEKLKSENLKTFTSLLLTLLNDLESWRDIIFIKQEAIDIHYLDASLLSSCLQIEAIFEEKVVDEGDDLEFF